MSLRQRREKGQKLIAPKRRKNGLVHLHESGPLTGLGSKSLAGFERPSLDGILRRGLQGDGKRGRLLARFCVEELRDSLHALLAQRRLGGVQQLHLQSPGELGRVLRLLVNRN